MFQVKQNSSVREINKLEWVVVVLRNNVDITDITPAFINVQLGLYPAFSNVYKLHSPLEHNRDMVCTNAKVKSYLP